jgi:hypothetical protein
LNENWIALSKTVNMVKIFDRVCIGRFRRQSNDGDIGLMDQPLLIASDESVHLFRTALKAVRDRRLTS